MHSLDKKFNYTLSVTMTEAVELSPPPSVATTSNESSGNVSLSSNMAVRTAPVK